MLTSCACPRRARVSDARAEPLRGQRTTRPALLPCTLAAPLTLLLLGAGVAGCSGSPGVRPPIASADSLEARALKQRMERDYGGALATTRELLDCLQADSHVQDWRVGDARRSQALLTGLVQGSSERRRLLGAADSLNMLFKPYYDAQVFDSAAAYAHAELPLRLASSGPDSFETARAYNDIAVTVQELGQYDEAITASLASLRINRAMLEPDHPDIDATLNNLAGLYDDTGRLAEAEALYRESLAMTRATQDTLSLATGLNNLGLDLNRQGNMAEAEAMLSEAVELRGRVLGDTASEVAQARLNLAAIQRDAGKYAAARQTITRAIEILGKAPELNWPDYAKAEQILGVVLYGEHEFAAAERFFWKGMEIQRRARLEGSPAYARAAVAWSRSVLMQGRAREVEPRLREAEATLRGSRGRLSAEHIDCTVLLGDLAAALGRLDEAEKCYADAAQAYDAARDRSVPGQSEVIHVESPYPRLALARLKLGHLIEAWPAAERYLGRGLASDVATARAERASSVERGRIDSLGRDLSNARSSVDALVGAGDAVTREQRSRAARALELAEARWIEYRLEAQRTTTAVADWTTIESVQRFLRRDEALVGWLLVDAGPAMRGAYAYVIRSAGAVEWIALPDTASSDAMSRLLRAALRTPGSNLAPMRWAWSSRLAPVLSRLDGIRRLIVVPSGDLLGVPIEPLASPGGKPLGELFEIVYSPSATLFAWGRARSPARPWSAAGPRILGFSDPPFSRTMLRQMRSERRCGGSTGIEGDAPGARAAILLEDSLRGAVLGNRVLLGQLPRLPATRHELETLRRYGARGSRYYSGEKSTEPELVRLVRTGELQQMDILHFATHAILDEERPERSALVLSQVDLPDQVKAALEDQRIYDGLVSAGEILHEWRLDANLVTLSACETGLGRRAGGEGYLGLADACLRRGAHGVLVSLWEVDDRVTAMLMEHFYRTLLSDRAHRPSKSMALAAAKRWIRDYQVVGGVRPYGHPYYWAGFVLVGDGD